MDLLLVGHETDQLLERQGGVDEEDGVEVPAKVDHGALEKGKVELELSEEEGTSHS